MKPFHPLFRNSHAQTIAANYWPRGNALGEFPAEDRLIPVSEGEQVLVRIQCPQQAGSRKTLLLLHGLESSAEAGYMRSLAAAALRRGYRVWRVNTRTCGGGERFSRKFYHAGLTADLEALLRRQREESGAPAAVIGFSLGANMALKLAGQLGEKASLWMAAVAAISPPLDLEACSRRMASPGGKLYDLRFTIRLRNKYRRFHARYPDLYPLEKLRGATSVRDFDERITAPLFGFDGAIGYYRTQSSGQFLHSIRTPTLVIHAKDDPLVPFDSFHRFPLRENPHITTCFSDHGGHVAFLARGAHVFWVDTVTLDWLEGVSFPQG